MKRLVPFNKNYGMRSSGGFEDFYNMLDDFFTEPLTAGRNLSRDIFKLDIEDKKDRYVIEVELPGIKKDEIDLELYDGRLSISIERQVDEDKEEKNYIHKERKYSSMSRSIYLGDVKEDDISAKLEEGILCISIPKKEKGEETKNIPIE